MDQPETNSNENENKIVEIQDLNKSTSDKKSYSKKIIISLIIVISLILLFYLIKKKNHYDYLIVGSGLFGSTFGYLAKKQGKSVIIIEKRPNIGGNLYCENIEGINVHKYGPHIFHTNNKKVWDFVNNLVSFTPFQNKPIANYKGNYYSLPFNMMTFYQLWGVKTPEEARKKIEEQKFKGEITNLEEQALSLVGKDVYEKLIKGYTEKQWGRECKNLPPFIIKRLPVRYTFDNNYFKDKYQGIPEGGYNKLIDKLTEGIKVLTNTDYFGNKDKYNKMADKIVYTGKIDEYFKFIYGKLKYRTVRWENEILKTKNYQGNALINYVDKDVPYTRVIEHKHFEPYNQEILDKEITVVSKEFSEEWTDEKEGYYPVNDETNNNLYNRYKLLADKEKNVIFGGRLAEYKYYDMKDIIESVFKYFKI